MNIFPFTQKRIPGQITIRRGAQLKVVYARKLFTRAARGGILEAFGRLKYPKSYLERAGARETLTRISWEAELAERHPSRKGNR